MLRRQRGREWNGHGGLGVAGVAQVKEGGCELGGAGTRWRRGRSLGGPGDGPQIPLASYNLLGATAAVR